MANIIDIFKAGGIKTTELVGEKGFYSSEQEIYENSKLQQKFISNVDYSNPVNFARFGSAEEYYRQAVNYISTNYPHDGSSTVKTKWINDLNEFEYYLFKNEYPRSSGSVELSSSQTIVCEPYLKDDTSDAKLAYLDQDRYKYNTRIDFSSGSTFESWIKLATTGSTDILTVMSGTQKILIISASGSNFHISGSAESTLSGHTIENSWHHYAFRVDTASVELFVDGQKKLDSSINISTSLIPAAKLVLGGTNLLSLDESRLWDGKRSIEKIGRFWFTTIDGNDKHGVGDLGPTEPQLIFYYKYNEGLEGTSSYIIKDSSGRQNHAIVQNPTVYNFRKSESAINACGFINDVEPGDPIYGNLDESSALSQFYDDKIEIGLEHDNTNLHSLYKKFPTWILESEEDNEIKHLKQLVQVVSVYFDDLYNKIAEISQYKHQKNVDSDDKIYPFYDKILTSTGFDVTELFSNLEGVETVSSRDDLNLFDQNVQKVKNQIYQNIYNNLAYILKSKGTEKSIKSLLRSYGVDENLVKINLYGDLGQHNVADKYKERYINKKTITLTGSQYISANVSSLASSTIELQTFIPQDLNGKISLLRAGPATVFLSGSGQDLILQLSCSSGSDNSSYFKVSDKQMPWNISIRKSEQTYALDAINYTTSNLYTHVSASVTNGDLVDTVFVGSSGGHTTDIAATDVAIWNISLNIDELKVHAKDITNYGIADVKNLTNAIVAYWDFEKITAATVPDIFNSNSGIPSEDLTTNIQKQNIKTYKTINFDVLDAEDTIQIFEDDDISDRSMLKKPSSTSMLIENSMYQIISDEMINMFSSIKDYAFQFAEAGNLYSDTYKNIDILRNSFFSKILNTPDIEKYIEFYKWLDSSIGYMLDQLKPENSNSTSGLKNTIESHMLERNKFKHKLPLTIGPDNVFAVSASILRNSGYADINPILADHEGKKYRGMVSSSYGDPVITVKNTKNFNFVNNYEVVQTSGKSINNRGAKENKTVFRTDFSSADGLSELNRDASTGGEYSIYNSLLNKSRDVRDLLDYSSSLSTNIQTFVQLNTAIDLLNSTELSASDIKYAKNTKHVLCFTSSYYPLKIGNIIYIQEDLYGTDSKLVTLSGYKTINAISSSYFVFDNDSNNTYATDIDKPTPRGIWLLNAEKTNISGDNSFVQRNIPYTASNYAHTTSVDYQAIPNELILNQRRTNAITASGAGYREPPVEWNVPMYHNIKIVGAFENMEVLSPYSSRVNDFANENLNTFLKLDSKNDSASFYRKIDNLQTGSVEVYKIEHLENIFPKKTLMGLLESRTKVLYPEVSGAFSASLGNWSTNSYNRKTSGIRSLWSDSVSARKRTRGIDTVLGTGSINVANEYNFSSSVSNVVLDKTGSAEADKFMFVKIGGTKYYINLSIKNTINRHDSIYGMDAISSIIYSGSN